MNKFIITKEALRIASGSEENDDTKRGGNPELYDYLKSLLS